MPGVEFGDVVVHAEIEVGSVRITALLDAIATFPRALGQTFRDVPISAWEPYEAAYPEAFDAGAWHLRLYCFLVRDGERTVLVDTGIGPSEAPAAVWFGVAGRLLDELSAIHLTPDDIDDVVLTHLHLDHVGWNVQMRDGAPVATFPRARYLVHRADWDLFSSEGDANDREAFEALVRPLAESGALELVSGDQPLTAALTLVHTPGHTPGSQSLAIESEGRRALLWGDVATHPAQITEPQWSGTDMDYQAAAATRVAVLESVEKDHAVVAPAHFPDPFGVIVRRDGRRWWQPVARR